MSAEHEPTEEQAIQALAEAAWLVALAADRYKREEKKSRGTDDFMAASERLYDAVNTFREAKEQVPHFNRYIATDWLVRALQREKNDSIQKQLDVVSDIRRRYRIL